MIGIGITTRNRREVFAKTLTMVVRFMPKDAKLVVVDDASDVPLKSSTYRFEENVGVARAKNKCLELLDDCHHIFLFDDDCHPIKEDWWKPYVHSKENHLMYQFKLPYKPHSDMSEVFRDGEVVAYTHTRGSMLYVKRRVLDVVGGMDTRYGLGMYEHTDWTNRIHNAGLTRYRAMDVPGSNELLYCLDQDQHVASAIPDSVRKRNMLANRKLYHASKTSNEFKEYK